MENNNRKIKHYELFNISKGLEDLNGISGVQLGIYKGKLSRVVNQHIEDLRAFLSTPEWKRIDDLSTATNLKHCSKDEKGDPIIIEGKYSFSPENEKLRSVEIKELMETEKEAIAERERLLKEYTDILKTDTPYSITTFPYSVIQEVENIYIKLGKPSPFKSETIDLLTSIIDMET